MFESEFENEDVGSEVSSTSQDSDQSSSDKPAQEGQSASKPEAELPFHQHPRFQELIQERKSMSSQFEKLQAQYADMEKRYQTNQQEKEAASKPVNPFVAKLREIDPAYAEYIESLETRASKADTIEQRLQEQDRQRLVSDYESGISKLYSDNKVPEELRPFIKEQLDSMAISGQLKHLKDLPEVFKSVQERYSKLAEGWERKTRASYVTDKGKDSAAPSSQNRGKPAKPGSGKSEYTGDRENDMALIARKALRISKAENDI